MAPVIWSLPSAWPDYLCEPVFSTYILKLIVFLARYFAACSETSMESGLQPYF
jgi:hypothetical protein